MFSYDGASKNKNEIVYCFYCNGHLKHIHMPPHQHPATSSTMYTTTATSRGSIFPQRRLPNNTDGAQIVKNQTILVGGVYHRRYTPPPDTTATDLPVRTFLRDV